MTETRSLHRKLAQVMYEAERIPKRGRAPAAMGGFEFVQVGDAADVIRKALAEHKVSMIPSAIDLIDSTEHSTSTGKSMTTVTVRTTWSLTDGDSGETAVIQSMGSGADMGDKAIPKAQSNAMKYALLMGFLLSTGDDPELSDTSDRRPRQVADSSARNEAASVVRAEGGLIGIASLGRVAAVDGELRETPQGMSVGFVLGEGREKLQVVAYGPLAQVLHPLIGEIVGKRVQVFGPVSADSMKVGNRNVPFERVTLERIVTTEWTLPAPESDDAPEPEPNADGPTLFDPDEAAAIGEAVEKAGAA